MRQNTKIISNIYSEKHVRATGARVTLLQKQVNNVKTGFSLYNRTKYIKNEKKKKRYTLDIFDHID